jgi:hypothetical protein
MARSLNIVIGADIEKLQKGFNDAVSVVQSSGKKMSEAAAETAKSIQDRLASIATKNPTAGTVRQLTNLAMEARALGPEFAGVANEIIKQAGRIKDSIGDARAEVGYFASDTRRLDAVLGGVNAVAGAFGAVEGALALSGVQSEDLQKTMVKLQGAIALVNGVTAIQAALQKESAVMQGVLSAATTVQTFVMGQATIAARVYSAALIATGAGAVIVAIGLVITLFQKSGKAIEEAKEKLALLEKQQERGLTLGQRRIKEEERALDLLVSRAQAEGKSEQYIYNLKKASLEKQKGIYQQYGKEALELLDRQRNAELYTVEANSKEATAIRKKYTQLESDLRYSINNEYQSKVASLQMDADNIAKSARSQDLKDYKQNTKDKEKAAKELADLEADLAKTGKTKGTGAGAFQVLDPEQEKKSPAQLALEDIEASKAKFEETPPITAADLFAADDITTEVEVIKTSIGTLSPEMQAMADTSSQAFRKHKAEVEAATAAQLAYEERVKQSMEQVNNAFNQLTAQGLEEFGTMIGDLLTGQADTFESFGKRLLTAVAGFMKSFGQALVATAIASKAFKELLIKNPVLAAAAGVALIAGSAVITNMLNKGPAPTAFAEGGIVSGPTLGLVGEYPGASSNPEVIAPLDKLRSMIKTNDTSGYIASTTIQGRDLAIVLERYSKDSKRG